MKLGISILWLITFISLSSCNLILEIGLEKVPDDQSGVQQPSQALISPTGTASPSPTPMIPTITPSPTPLPGSVVFPLSSLSSDIPWLPLDRAKWPSSIIITINNQLPPFNDPLVRKAFAASIDRDQIVEMAEMWYADDPRPATSFIHPQTLGRNLYGEVGINYDPAAARDLLIQAGYSDPASFPRVTFIVNSYGDTAPGARYNMAVAIAGMWKTHLGVTVDVEALQPPHFGERIRTNPPELFWNGWLPDPGNDPDFIRSIFMTDGVYNYGHFSSPDFDTLVQRASYNRNPAARQALYIEAERILSETQVGIIPLYHTYSNIP